MDTVQKEVNREMAGVVLRCSSYGRGQGFFVVTEGCKQFVDTV
jgi:hypothetical protein